MRVGGKGGRGERSDAARFLMPSDAVSCCAQRPGHSKLAACKSGEEELTTCPVTLTHASLFLAQPLSPPAMAPPRDVRLTRLQAM